MQTTGAIGFLLQHISSIIAKQSDQVLQEQLGIGFSQFKILRTLQKNPHTRQCDIAGRLGQTEASISRQVKLMLDEGLLQLIISPRDHREHLTIVTHKGERVTHAAIQALNKYHAPTFAALSDKELILLKKYLTLLHAKTCPGDHPDSGAINKSKVKD